MSERTADQEVDQSLVIILAEEVISKAKTVEEVREEFLDHIAGIAAYWAKGNRTTQERCDGVAFSILNILDGTSAGLPAMDLALSPHPDDKDYLKEAGEDWYEEGMVINDCMLHELYPRHEKAKVAPNIQSIIPDNPATRQAIRLASLLLEDEAEVMSVMDHLEMSIVLGNQNFRPQVGESVRVHYYPWLDEVGQVTKVDFEQDTIQGCFVQIGGGSEWVPYHRCFTTEEIRG